MKTKFKITALILLVSLLVGCNIVIRLPADGYIDAYVGIPLRPPKNPQILNSTIEPSEVTFSTEALDMSEYIPLSGALVTIGDQSITLGSKGEFRVYDLVPGWLEIGVDHEFLRNPLIFETYITSGRNDLDLIAGIGYFISVGISDYKYLLESDGSDNDARGVHQVFGDPNISTQYGQNASLINHEASKEQIKKTIDWAIRDAKQTRLPGYNYNYLVFYFSGHMGKDFLIPEDGSGYLDETVITDVELENWLGDFPGYVTVILEGHKSGSFIDGKHRRPIRPYALKRNHYTVITSTDGEEKRETGWFQTKSGYQEYGLFTGYLIAGLSTPKERKKVDRNGDRLITAKEIFDYVSYKVSSETMGKQNPDHYVGSEDNNVILRYGR